MRSFSFMGIICDPVFYNLIYVHTALHFPIQLTFYRKLFDNIASRLDILHKISYNAGKQERKKY